MCARAREIRRDSSRSSVCVRFFVKKKPFQTADAAEADAGREINKSNVESVGSPSDLCPITNLFSHILRVRGTKRERKRARE